MIETDGQPTVASKRIDPLIERALAAGGHLADDVARAVLDPPTDTVEHEYCAEFAAVEIDGVLYLEARSPDAEKLIDTLRREDEALD